MKEHEDDALNTVKESTATVDSTTGNKTVTAKGKIEGLFGEKDEGEDMVVDVVGADVVVDDRSGTKADSKGKVDTNGVTEGSKSEITSSDKDVDKVRVVEEVKEVTVTTSEKVEVVVNDEGVKTSVEVSKEVIQENVVTKEIVEKSTESVQEVVDGDVVMNERSGKESDVSRDVAAAQEELFGKDEGEDAVNVGTGEDNIHVSPKILDQVDQTKETAEVATNEVQDSGNGKEKVEEIVQEVADSKKIPDSETKVDGVVVEEGKSGKDEVSKIPVSESTDNEKTVQEVADVDTEKTGKDDVLDSTKIPSLSSEDIDQKVQMEIDNTSHLTTEVKIDNTQKSIEVVDKDHVMDEKTEKEEVFSEAVDQKTEVDHQILNVDTEMKVENFDEGLDLHEVMEWETEIPNDSLNIQEKDQDFKIEDHTDFCRQQESEPVDQSTLSDFTPEKNETSISFQQQNYFHSPLKEGDFSPSDLVWGKVRSHPWWPGQIFDQSDASNQAMKYHKKDRFLVAYFGDRSFAWNDATVLKPFRAKFSQIEKPANSDAFNNALSCALEEVSRRIELGLTCSCTPRDILKKIECQIVENAGIKKDSSKRKGKDETALVSSFEPDKLVDYVRLLAKSPYSENDKLDLVMAKAQLLSCARFKGYRELSEFQICGDLIEDPETLTEVDQSVKKEINFTDLKIYASLFSGDESRKRKAPESNSDLQTPESVTPSAKPSFKVGEVIKRFATQLSDKNTEPIEQVSQSQTPVNSVNANLPEMLSQLHLTAQDPMKGYSFLNSIIPFFYSHRSAVFTKSLKQNSSSGRINEKKRKSENDPEDFEFDDVNDSYWTDRIIQNHPEDLQLQQQQVQVNSQVNESQNGNHQIVAYEEKEKPVIKQSRRSNKKRFFSSNHEIEAKEQNELIERRRLNLATEVLMKFNEGIYFPSEIHLNKMFRRFGPLMESETEVDRQSGRARVVFKKCSDAEVAHSSAGKFNIFGSINVTYELNYTPLISYKPLPLPIALEPAE